MIDTTKREFFEKVGAALAIPLVSSDVCFIGDNGERKVIRAGKALWFVDIMNVNLEDLVRARTGSIVRCRGNPAEVVKIYHLP